MRKGEGDRERERGWEREREKGKRVIISRREGEERGEERDMTAIISHCEGNIRETYICMTYQRSSLSSGPHCEKRVLMISLALDLV